MKGTALQSPFGERYLGVVAGPLTRGVVVPGGGGGKDLTCAEASVSLDVRSDSKSMVKYGYAEAIGRSR